MIDLFKRAEVYYLELSFRSRFITCDSLSGSRQTSAESRGHPFLMMYSSTLSGLKRWNRGTLLPTLIRAFIIGTKEKCRTNNSQMHV